MIGRVLIIAGSDSGGGAGIQADLKAVTCLGGYAMTAITALTAQNTRGVHGIHEVPAEFIARQIQVVLNDIGADCVKIGMLHRPEVIHAVAETLAEVAPRVPVVVDPVMVAKGGAALLDDAAVATLKSVLLPMATLITPNLPEAAALTGLTLDDEESRIAAGRTLIEQGAGAVLMKGGHGHGDTLLDLLIGPDGVRRFEGPRLITRHTHGTGCTLASAIATGLAEGLKLVAAVARARAYVRAAIEAAPGLGQGHGPLGHGHTLGPSRT